MREKPPSAEDPVGMHDPCASGNQAMVDAATLSTRITQVYGRPQPAPIFRKRPFPSIEESSSESLAEPEGNRQRLKRERIALIVVVSSYDSESFQNLPSSTVDAQKLHSALAKAGLAGGDGSESSVAGNPGQDEGICRPQSL